MALPKGNAPMKYLIGLAVVLLFAGIAATEDSDVKKSAFQSVDKLPATAELPDPFLRPCAARVRTKEEWAQQRKELLACVLHYEYGPLPPVPGKIVAKEYASKERDAAAGVEKQLVLTMGPGDAVQTRLFLNLPSTAFKKGPFPTP